MAVVGEGVESCCWLTEERGVEKQQQQQQQQQQPQPPQEEEDEGRPYC